MSESGGSGCVPCRTCGGDQARGWHLHDTAEAEPLFGFPVGPWFRWFAWHPVKTTDRGWRWLRPVWRRRYQSYGYLDGPTVNWFNDRVFPPAEKEAGRG